MIELNVDQLSRVERTLGHIPDSIPKVVARAINRAADTAKTEAAKTVRRTYYISHKDVLSTMRIYRATPNDMQAAVVSKGQVVPLAKFRMTPKKPDPRRKKPIVARVMRGSGGPIKHAFVARMKSGHVGVFWRVGKKRLPLEQRFGPSVPEMLNSPSTIAWVERKANEKLDERLDHEMKRVLEGNE